MARQSRILITKTKKKCVDIHTSTKNYALDMLDSVITFLEYTKTLTKPIRLTTNLTATIGILEGPLMLFQPKKI